MESQAGGRTSLQHDLNGLQDRLDKALVEIASLQKEHEGLRQQNTTLATQLSSVEAEKEALRAKLSSLKELKLAIRDVKSKMREERLAAWRQRIEAFREADQERLASGNRGYVVREGKPTLGTGSTRLRVHVLEPKSQ